MNRTMTFNIVLDLNDEGAIQDFNIFDILPNLSSLERVSVADRKVIGCPKCHHQLEATLHINSPSHEVLEEYEDLKTIEVIPDISMKLEDTADEEITEYVTYIEVSEEPELPGVTKDVEIEETEEAVYVVQAEEWKCSRCNQAFKSKAGLRSHEKTCEGNKIPVCDICSIVYGTFLKLKKHKRAVHDVLWYSCSQCDASYKKKWLLEEHLIKHDQGDNKPFKCHHCNKAFSGKNSIKVHLTTEHSTTFQGFPCNLCEKTFNSQKGLRHHIMRHKGKIKISSTEVKETSVPMYKCEVCGKKFKKKANCARHATIHAGRKDFSCDVCAAKFRLAYQVKAHMAVHYALTYIYTCNVCQKTYRDKVSYKKHVKAHEEGVS